MDRYYMLKDQVDYFLNTNQIIKVKDTEDPFYDPPEQIEVGISYIMLKPLVYMFDIVKNLPMYGSDNKIGSINIEIYPCDVNGNKIDDEELEEEVCDP